MLHDFQTGYVDGQCKCLIMLSIVSFCAELEFGEREMTNPQMEKVLSSFGSIRCSFEQFENAGQYYLQALRNLSTILRISLSIV